MRRASPRSLNTGGAVAALDPGRTTAPARDGEDDDETMDATASVPDAIILVARQPPANQKQRGPTLARWYNCT